MSHSAGGHRDRAELPQEARDLWGIAEGDVGVLGLECYFAGLPRPVEHHRGGAWLESLTGLELVGASTHSEYQPGVSSMLGVTTEGEKTPNSTGEIGVTPLWSVLEAGSRLFLCWDQTRWVFAHVVSHPF